MNSYKKYARSNKGFTLVELIVVIAVLAVLAMIAFTSVQNISMDARNSKRVTDVSSLRSQMAIKISGGSSLASFITPNAANLHADLTSTPSAANVTAGSGTFAGNWKGSIAPVNLVAGDVNYDGLGLKKDDFSEGDSKVAYKMAKMDVDGGVYEIAGLKEASTGNTALVSGTYMPRIAAGSVSTSMVSTGTLTVATKTIKLQDKDIGKFDINDIVTLHANLTDNTTNVTTTTVAASSATGYVISAIGSDGSITLYGSVNYPATNAPYAITLSGTTNEVPGLIRSTTTGGAPVTNGGINLPW